MIRAFLEFIGVAICAAAAVIFWPSPAQAPDRDPTKPESEIVLQVTPVKTIGATPQTEKERLDALAKALMELDAKARRIDAKLTDGAKDGERGSAKR